jgi:hypothetical protein
MDVKQRRAKIIQTQKNTKINLNRKKKRIFINNTEIVLRKSDAELLIVIKQQNCGSIKVLQFLIDQQFAKKIAIESAASVFH